MNDSDRELLKMAAKAAGIAIVPCTCSDKSWPFKHNEAVSGKYGHWNPLEDDGDALRLAVNLRLEILNDGFVVVARNLRVNKGAQESCAVDECTATRRAIVRAAAEIGRNAR